MPAQAFVFKSASMWLITKWVSKELTMCVRLNWTKARSLTVPQHYPSECTF